MASAILKAMTAFLDVLPIAYAVRIDTSDGEVFHHAGSEPPVAQASGRPAWSLRATTAAEP